MAFSGRFPDRWRESAVENVVEMEGEEVEVAAGGSLVSVQIVI